jgi:uncharacterized membrane protein YedE/YeeE
MTSFGRVTGSSGILKASIGLTDTSIDERLFALLFSLGLIGAGFIAWCWDIFSKSLDDWEDLPWQILIPSGILVGIGTSAGNGCTSGHGICGISSMRIRSIIATCIFIATGMITAVLVNTKSYTGPTFENYLALGDAGILAAVCLFVITLLLYISSNMAAKSKEHASGSHDHVRTFRMLSEVLMGLCFGFGLVISNMTRPAATISFLDPQKWNPALVFIMGSAIAVAGTSFYVIGLLNGKGSPFLGTGFKLAVRDQIDTKLVVGAALFGVGWGMSGACPAPAIANLFNFSAGPKPVIYLVCVVAGMFSENNVSSYMEKEKKISNEIVLQSTD